MKEKVFALAAAVSLLLIACSSTRTPTAGDDPPTELAPGVASADPGRAATPGGNGTIETAEDPGAGISARSGATGARRPETTTGAIDFGPPGQGVTSSTVKVGVWVLNTDSACNAAGAAGQTPGDCSNRDNVAEANTLTDWVNANGGVGGRALEVVVHETNANNSSWVAQAESACERFAEDEKVFLAISEPQVGRPHFTTCMAEKGIPVIDPGPWVRDSKDYEDLFPYLYQPSRPRADRWTKVYLDHLARRRFFDGDVKVGLFRFDSPTHTRVTQNVLLPRLAAHGVAEVEEAVLRTPASIAALGDMNAEMSSHILRFNDAGVNRVIFFVNSEFHFFYFRQADSQGFRPRYGMNSIDLLTLVSENAPNGQLDGAIAVGWAPGYDTPRHKDPGLNGPARICKRIMQQAGLNDPWEGRNIKCDAYFFLKQVLDRAPAINVNGLRTAVEALGRSYEPNATFATRFRPGRYDGPSRWRPMNYDGPCGCFVYTGRARPF